MESAGSLDLFATKGVEYLLVLGFLPVLVLFWRLLNERKPSPDRALAPPSSWFRFDDTRFHHQGHGWAMPEGQGVVKIGIDDFAQKLIGIPGSIDLPPVGTRLRQAETGWRMRVDDESIDLLSPVDGEVVEVNESVRRSPDLVDRDPYGEGWLVKVRVPRWKINAGNLLCGAVARTWMEETTAALRARMVTSVGVVLQDGGVPVTGIAKSLSDDDWPEIAREFLLTTGQG
jgi:glycine cleavage system H lipoate-binding protein